MNPSELGRRLRAARRRAELRQDELAALCGVGTRFISDLENGKPGIELGRMLLIANALGFELELAERNWSGIEALDER